MMCRICEIERMPLENLPVLGTATEATVWRSMGDILSGIDNPIVAIEFEAEEPEGEYEVVQDEHSDMPRHEEYS